MKTLTPQDILLIAENNVKARVGKALKNITDQYFPGAAIIEPILEVDGTPDMPYVYIGDIDVEDENSNVVKPTSLDYRLLLRNLKGELPIVSDERILLKTLEQEVFISINNDQYERIKKQTQLLK
jgi:hypothetical protein